VKEFPLLFSDPGVRAYFDRRKTEARSTRGLEAVNNNPDKWSLGEQGIRGGKWMAVLWWEDYNFLARAKGAPGDTIWGRETFIPKKSGTIYRADYDGCEAAGLSGLYGGWKPSIHMRREHARILPICTAIRVERLQDITEEGAEAEGITSHVIHGGGSHVNQVMVYRAFPEKGGGLHSARAAYEFLWESINGRGSWDLNPWVFVYQFDKWRG
jgi:hypothetical protein